jgi:hypothetical protein
MTKPNSDIVKERLNANCNSDKLKSFIGKILFGSGQRYEYIKKIRSLLLEEIKPIDYNFYNLDRSDRYEFTFKKTIELTNFFDKYHIRNQLERSYLQATTLGTEKYLFSLHNHMVR